MSVKKNKFKKVEWQKIIDVKPRPEDYKNFREYLRCISQWEGRIIKPLPLDEPFNILFSEK